MSETRDGTNNQPKGTKSRQLLHACLQQQRRVFTVKSEFLTPGKCSVSRDIGMPLLVAPLRAPAASLLSTHRPHLFMAASQNRSKTQQTFPRVFFVTTFSKEMRSASTRRAGGSLPDTSGSMACSKYRARQTKRSQVNHTRGAQRVNMKKSRPSHDLFFGKSHSEINTPNRYPETKPDTPKIPRSETNNSATLKTAEGLAPSPHGHHVQLTPCSAPKCFLYCRGMAVHTHKPPPKNKTSKLQVTI